MKEEKIILTDCDGVLLAWEDAFHDWMKSKGFTKKAEATYDISASFGIPKTLGKKFILRKPSRLKSRRQNIKIVRDKDAR